MKNTKKTINTLILLFLITGNVTWSWAQSPEQKAIKALSFLTGEWKGTGQSYPLEKSKPYDVLSKVSFDLDGELLIIYHRSFRGKASVLHLHTVIYYDQKDRSYYYNAYTKSGTRPFKCQLESQQFICYRGTDYRLIFGITDKGQFNEYGEKLRDGQWQKTFEDILMPAESIKFK